MTTPGRVSEKFLLALVEAVQLSGLARGHLREAIAAKKLKAHHRQRVEGEAERFGDVRREALKMKIKKFFSKRIKPEWKCNGALKQYWSWGFDVTLKNGQRVREPGFMTPAAATKAAVMRLAEGEGSKLDLKDAHPFDTPLRVPRKFALVNSEGAGKDAGPMLLSISEASKLTGLSETHLRQAIKDGKLAGAQVESRLKVRGVAELEKYVEGLSVVVAPQQAAVNGGSPAAALDADSGKRVEEQTSNVPENDNSKKKTAGRKPFITEGKVRAAYQTCGPYASQEEIAHEIGVSVGSFSDWHRKKKGLSYAQCQQRYGSTYGN